MNKKMAKIADGIADKILGSANMDALLKEYAQKTETPLVEVMIYARETILTAVGEELQPLLYPEFCPGCGERLCTACGEHMIPPMDAAETEAEGWDLCLDCGLYVKDDGTEIVVPPVGSQDVRVLRHQAQKRASRSYLN